jgi:DNA-binding HxlR family transcriptional regulator
VASHHNYDGQACSLARTLEIVGERWTLLIVRDAFYGVRRFGDFALHLGIPRAVLTERLKLLTSADILVRVPCAGGRDEYQLTDKGVSLWPTLRVLVAWGDDNYPPTGGARRLFVHADDDGAIDQFSRCTRCGATVGAVDTMALPGPGLSAPSADADPVTVALSRPVRLLEPLRATPVG